MNATTAALQIITDVEAQTDAGFTRGWIVPVGIDASADLELEAVDHVDIPATEDEHDWNQGMRDALANAGYALEGEIAQTGGIVTATVVAA